MKGESKIWRTGKKKLEDNKGKWARSRSSEEIELEKTNKKKG